MPLPAAAILLAVTSAFPASAPAQDAATAASAPAPAPAPSFALEEATIAGIHAAYRDGTLRAEQLVDRYLERIARLDAPRELNAYVVLNPHARERARQLDQEFADTGVLRPLHGIPMVIKDNYDTHDLQTAGGSIALKGSLPPDDAFMVRRLREAGAIVLGKSNMDEWAFSPLKTVSSILGTTANPYDLRYVPAGSSGGTAAAVAANLAAIGLGTDTGNSVRGPSSHCALVGIRPTIGLTSRDGIIPLSLTADVGGPMGRTVEDVARVLAVVAGRDAADPATAELAADADLDFPAFLDEHALDGARLGVLRAYFEPDDTDAQVLRLMEQALADLELEGAILLDPFVLPEVPRTRGRRDPSFRAGVDLYLSSLGEDAPYRRLSQIVAAGQFHPALERRLQGAVRGEDPSLEGVRLGGPDGDPAREAFRTALLDAMHEHELDAIVYPTWRHPPREIEDRDRPHGDNNQVLAPRTGLPALTVPMGFTEQGLPTGLQFLGRPFDDGRLLGLGHAYEQATRHRRPPPQFSEER